MTYPGGVGVATLHCCLRGGEAKEELDLRDEDGEGSSCRVAADQGVRQEQGDEPQLQQTHQDLGVGWGVGRSLATPPCLGQPRPQFLVSHTQLYSLCMLQSTTPLSSLATPLSSLATPPFYIENCIMLLLATPLYISAMPTP